MIFKEFIINHPFLLIYAIIFLLCFLFFLKFIIKVWQYFLIAMLLIVGFCAGMYYLNKHGDELSRNLKRVRIDATRKIKKKLGIKKLKKKAKLEAKWLR